jgi:hypothetical protein
MQRKQVAIHGRAPLRNAPWIFWSVAALSLLIAEETLADARDPSVHAFGWWLVTLVFGFILRIVSRTALPLESTATLMSLLAMGFLTPFVFTYWSNSFGTTALPMELQLLSSLRNMILLIAFIPRRNHLQPLVVVATVFVAIFAAAQGSHPLLLATIAVWGALAAAWMASTLTAVGREKPPFPFAAVSLIVIAFVLLSGWHAILPSAGGSVLAEWLNSSGGTSTKSSDARSGVGDGDASTDDGENPESDGGDGKKFVESHERSFYDALTEAYGEPYKPKDVQRAVPLPMQLLVGHQRAKSHQASREFSLNRKTTKRKLSLKDRAATSLLYVTGPTPIHLRLRTYAVFDGDVWHDVDESDAHSELRVERERWLQIGSVVTNLSAEPVAHTLKVGAYSDRMVPLPALTREFRIGLVNRGDFFAQPSDEVIWLASENAKIVGGEIIETISDTVVMGQISPDLMTSAPANDLYRWIPDDPSLRETLSATVRNWTDASGDRWQEVQAIIHRLRTDFVHEPAREGSIPTSSDIAAFLTTNRKGPDFLFATAAALLLRELGCSTRLAVGYYAGPEHFDAWSRSTPIQPSQLHTWAEVLIAGRWIPVEPTPGYRVLGPQWTWSGRIRHLAHTLYGFVLRHPAVAMASALSLVAIIRCRLILLDTVFTLVCLLGLRYRGKESLQWTRWLLDRRLRLAGRPRPASLSLRRWFAKETVVPEMAGASLQAYLARFDSATYGREPAIGDAADAEICRSVIDHWTIARLDGRARLKNRSSRRLQTGRQSADPRPEVLTNA